MSVVYLDDRKEFSSDVDKRDAPCEQVCVCVCGLYTGELMEARA